VLPKLSPECGGELVAVDVRHAEVEKDDVRSEPPRRLRAVVLYGSNVD
jgi:hypothetical protein